MSVSKPQKAASKASAKSEEDKPIERIGAVFDDLGDAIVLAIRHASGEDVHEEMASIVERARSRVAKRDVAFQSFLHRATGREEDRK